MLKFPDAILPIVKPMLDELGLAEIDRHSFWRQHGEVFQNVSFSTLRFGSPVVEVLVQSCQDDGLVLAGRMNPSSILGAGSVGPSGWPSIDRAELVSEAISTVATPVLNALHSDEELVKLSERLPHISYAAAEIEGKLPKVKPRRTPKLSFTPPDEMYAWIVRKFSAMLVGHGFEYQQDDRPVFIRRRGEVFDVVMFETINFGMHFAAYALNWLPEMSFDGSGEFRADAAVLLNGGVIKRGGVITPWGSAFVFGNRTLANTSATEFSRSVERCVAKSLREISNRNEFIRAIDPGLMRVAYGLPGLKKYL